MDDLSTRASQTHHDPTAMSTGRSRSCSTRVLSVANCKGGCGKTTTTVNLAAELGSRGHRVLVIDLDPQGHAGFGFGIVADPGGLNAHSPLTKPCLSLDRAIRRTDEPGVDLIPADRYFDGQIRIGDPRCLAKALATVKDAYDLVLLDVPPSTAAIAVCALMASDGAIVPTMLDPLGLEGVRQFARAYHDTLLRFDVAQMGLAIAPVRVDLRTNVERAILEQFRRSFGPDRMIHGVRTDISVSECFALRLTLRKGRPRSRAASDFAVLGDDVVARFDIPGRHAEPVRRAERERPVRSAV